MSLGALLCSARRRASDSGGAFVPTDLTGLALWLDADDASSITEAVTNQVSQWNDKSGNARHFSQATSGNQPATNITTINGKNAIDFDGVDDYLFRTSAFITALGSCAAFVVVKGPAQDNKYLLAEGKSTDPDTIFALIMSSDLPAGNDTLTMFYRDDFKSNDLVQSSFTSGLLYDSTVNIGLITDTVTTVKTFVDGGPEEHSIAYTRGTYTPDRVAIGGLLRATAGFHFNCSLAEIIIYDSVLSNTDLNLVGNYLNAKWAAPWTDI